MKSLELDGAILRFDRASGQNQLVRGPATAGCEQRAPRVVQVAITNDCNKTCGFCYRPLEAASAWNSDTLFEFGQYLAEWGVLEVALGGGEPTMLPGFTSLVERLWSETDLAVNFTSNGRLLTSPLLKQIQPHIGQVQVSVYDDEDTDEVIRRLVDHGVRFGLNYLVTPRRLRTLDADLVRWHGLGVRDVLLLSYKGDESLHLSPAELRDLDARLGMLHAHFGGTLQLKVDVCWSSRLDKTPQLFFDADCRAGGLFMSVTSDRKVLACSFSDAGIPFSSFEELPPIYRRLKANKPAAQLPGCARLPGFGLNAPEQNNTRTRSLPVFQEMA